MTKKKDEKKTKEPKQEPHQYAVQVRFACTAKDLSVSSYPLVQIGEKWYQRRGSRFEQFGRTHAHYATAKEAIERTFGIARAFGWYFKMSYDGDVTLHNVAVFKTEPDKGSREGHYTLVDLVTNLRVSSGYYSSKIDDVYATKEAAIAAIKERWQQRADKAAAEAKRWRDKIRRFKP